MKDSSTGLWPMKNAHALLWQGVLLLATGLLALWFGGNAAEHLARRGMSLDFGFLGQTAGFDIPFHILPFASTDTYLKALGIAFLNTVLVAVLGILAASALGLTLGIMRLSANWLVRNTAGVIVEVVRNTPQLLQIVFWYVGVLQVLPQARQSLSLADTVFLNIRGLFVPAPLASPATLPLLAALVLALVAVPLIRHRLPDARGRTRWLWLVPPALLAALIATLDGWSVPKLQGFNFSGGITLPPELVALWAGLTLYTAAFIAEIVRASIAGVGKGQTEAARSLGLKPWLTLRLVVLPQALRVMIPQVTSQYLNLIKSSSLGAAIAYPEIVQIFAGTVLNQSGRAIEVMVIVMLVFLAVNLAASAALERVNAATALKER
ncbi:ABC transporter permease subunit [Ancylobacter sp. A5.8]|uniref:amino acid ABC transporter permease n=1 Tax=Ancylobacter gelatini TaxID=2919920 RepID=UPI001F4E692A|nr:ABC transporter permease subunit [Ancylobacter gelatini]MCJ8144231.1 ABC transporter permease subunit [Ancylobacter gelatini]